MKIIIYGLGKGLEYIEKHLKNGHEIIGYSDSYTDIQIFKGRPFYKPEQLSAIDFEWLIIAVRDRKAAYKVYEMLTREPYGLEERKVIPFYVYANGEYWDYCMAHADLENMEGLILGTSYARWGLLTDYMSVPFLNLAVPSQDLYADLETFRACVHKYGKRLRKLKYLVIDMFDYNYFNFDASLCKLFFSHLEYGGIIKKHNYDRNRNYVNTFEEELFLRLGVKKQSSQKQVLQELFEEDYAIEQVVEPYSRYKSISHETSLPMGHFQAGIVKERDETVIQENVCNFEKLLSAIFHFNPKMQVVLVLFPKYITLEETKDVFMGTWKKEFEEIIKQYVGKNIHFFNYKFCNGISENVRLWQDIEHLNTVGAKCMTSIIEEDLKAIYKNVD